MLKPHHPQQGPSSPHAQRARRHLLLWVCMGLRAAMSAPILTRGAVVATGHDGSQLRMLMARAMTKAVVDKAMALCNVMSSFARRVSGIVSVGEKAAALVTLT